MRRLLRMYNNLDVALRWLVDHQHSSSPNKVGSKHSKFITFTTRIHAMLDDETSRLKECRDDAVREGGEEDAV